MSYCDYINRKKVLCNKKIKNGNRCSVHKNRKQNNIHEEQTNIIDLPNNILNEIIMININNIKTIKSDKKIEENLRSIINLYSSCKTLYKLYTERDIWEIIWNNLYFINKFHEINISDNKLKVLLYVLKGCQKCNAPKIRKVYGGINKRVCEYCFEELTISDYYLKKYYNIINIPDFLKYYEQTRTYKTGRYSYDEYTNKYYLRTDIEDYVFQCKFNEYKQNKINELFNGLYFDYKLFTKENFMEQLLSFDYIFMNQKEIIDYYKSYYYRQKITITDKYIQDVINNMDLTLYDVKQTDEYKNYFHKDTHYIDFDLILKDKYKKLFISKFVNIYKSKIKLYDYSYEKNLEQLYYNKVLAKDNNNVLWVNKNNFINILKTEFDIYSCDNCNLRFQDINYLNNHNCKYIDKKFICDICNKCLKSENGVNHHKRDVHNIVIN